MTIPNYNNPYVTLVFSTVLLRQHNYHMNLIDNMGYITKKTYTVKNLQIFIDKLKEEIKTGKWGMFNPAEIIFHDTINLDCLEEIWIDNKKLYNKLKPTIPKLVLIKFTMNFVT